MQERIDSLRADIARVKSMATTADKKAAAELHALAREMEQAVSEMEQRWVRPLPRAAHG